MVRREDNLKNNWGSARGRFHINIRKYLGAKGTLADSGLGPKGSKYMYPIAIHLRGCIHPDSRDPVYAMGD